MGGGKLVDAPGIYGTLGIPVAGNTPGARWSPSSWTDNAGNFWLFGGNGLDANRTQAFLNDLWKFNPSTKEWAWMGGSSTVPVNCAPTLCNVPGINGTLGVPAAGNTPEGRYLAASWTDSGGNLWLFGGKCLIAGSPDQVIMLNDLWEFVSSSNEWAWIGGASSLGCTGNQPGTYGTLGTPAASNIPSGRGSAVTWTDGSGNFLLLGGQGLDGEGQTIVFLNDLWEFNPSTKEWTWVSGSSTGNHPGVYGTLGTPAAANNPGGRSYSPSWIDESGNLWLFGGLGLDVNGVTGYMNDVWEYGSEPSLPAVATPAFSPTAGSYATAQSVTISDATPGASIYYTTNGTTPTTSSSVYSAPIAVSSTETIEAIATATGYSTSAVATATYTITTLAATPTFSVPAGSYSTAQSVTISDTTPGAVLHYTTDGTTPTTSSSVYSAPITVSSSETLKAIATATGYSASQVASAAYTITSSSSGTGEWTWMGGSSTLDGLFGRSGVYGTLGTPAASNIPGGRGSAASWTDPAGNLWLFGGDGYNGNGIAFNDLWEFNPSTNAWAWMSGSSTESCQSFCGQSGVYGTLGTPAAANAPGGRWSVSNWIDAGGHLWLYGGYGFDAHGALGVLNDLWEFNPSTSQWTWMGGSSTLPITGQGQPPIYGTLGTFAAGNNPGGRWAASTWTDSDGHFWLFGGEGYYAVGVPGTFNDIWEFNPATNQWAWMGGSNTAGSDCPNGVCQQVGVFGTLGTPAVGNVPASRNFAATWTDTGGHLWLFGGSVPGISYLDDLWEFYPSTNEWAWMGGGGKLDQPGVYGTEGAPASGNIPGARCCTVSWTDRGGQLWLFGGQGYDANDNAGDLNDLWTFNPSTKEWTWIGGSSTVKANGSQPGVYGTLGVPAAGNIPGGRQDSVSWTDKSGNFWLFGGSGADANDSLGNLNDLWKYGSATSTQPAAAIPTFTPPAGAYAAAQTVTISDTTPGAVIHYTTDSSTPTTSSNIYGTPIVVANSETLKAIATATGYATSAGASATYTVASPTATTLSASSSTLTYGQTLTLTATVTPASGATPTGTVTFYNSAVSLGKTALNGSGVAMLALTPSIGSYSITASYGGSADDAASTSTPVVVDVIASATTTTLNASPNPTPFGSTVTFTATVGSATAMPVGSASFYDGSVLLTTKALVSGVASYSTGALGVGSHNISATYAGGTGFNASTSNTVVEVISPVDFSISASPSAQTIYTGEAASYRVTITPGVGFDLPVALSCTQLPANTTCTFSPATVSGGSGSTTLTVQTRAPGKAATASALTTKVGVPMLAGFLLLFIPRRFRRSRNGWTMFLAILPSIALGAAITGCSAPGPLTGGTPVGTQALTITGVATNGSQTITHETTVMLNVKSLF